MIVSHYEIKNTFHLTEATVLFVFLIFCAQLCQAIKILQNQTGII